MIFRDDTHAAVYQDICSRMKSNDCYHQSMAYLLSLDVVLRKHYTEVFNFDRDGIIPEVTNREWQTGTSIKTTRLAFNLWNGYCYEDDVPSSYYTPIEIFCCDYAPYYWQAIRLRLEYDR